MDEAREWIRAMHIEKILLPKEVWEIVVDKKKFLEDALHCHACDSWTLEWSRCSRCFKPGTLCKSCSHGNDGLGSCDDCRAPTCSDCLRTKHPRVTGHPQLADFFENLCPKCITNCPRCGQLTNVTSIEQCCVCGKKICDLCCCRTFQDICDSCYVAVDSDDSDSEDGYEQFQDFDDRDDDDDDDDDIFPTARGERKRKRAEE